MNIGNAIAQLRKEHSITQQALAEMLFVSKDLVSKWENGIRRPDYATIEQIANIFNITPDAIIEKDIYIFEELSDCIPEGIQINESEFTQFLNGFLRKINKREAEIFIHRYYFLENITSISKKIGLQENHVRSKLSKTRKKIKKIIGRS